jgi:uncharacterized protein with GYD domain
MPYYLVQMSYTTEAVRTLEEHPHNRFEELRPVYEEFGITIREALLAFGDYDVVLLLEAPDNVRAAAISLAVTAGGAVAHYKTTPLLTWDEGVEANAGCGKVWLPTPQWITPLSDALPTLSLSKR